MLLQPAPDFSLVAIDDRRVCLADYRGSRRVILWFSRGFTCNFCRSYMDAIIGRYDELVRDGIEVIQVAPNLDTTARRYFRDAPPYPFLCDPEKRLYARYGLGDRGALEAFRNTFMTFGHAFTHGEGVETVRASWTDVANRDFLRRLHHHALTALDQAIFLIDTAGIVRFREDYRALAPIPDGDALRRLSLEHCP